MAVGGQFLGLCSTCDSRAICTRREGIRLPVLFCEDFDDSTPDVRSKPRPITEDRKTAVDVDTAMGLCCNCGNRDSCRLQDSPGGVWHCEEYC